MISFGTCVVDEVSEPVRLLDVFPLDNSSQRKTTNRSFTNAQELSDYFNNPESQTYQCRFINISRLTSWSPLQATRTMLDAIGSTHQFGEAFEELITYFYQRFMDLEETSCLPIVNTHDNNRREIAYTINYPEFKTRNNTWGIRTSGLFHQHDEKHARSVFVLFSPTPDAAAYLRMKALITKSREDVLQQPLMLHAELFGTHWPSWRQYTHSLEAELLPMVNQTFATFIDEPLRVGYDHLGDLVRISNRFLQMPAILSHGQDVIDELLMLSGGSVSSQLTRHRRQGVASTRTAQYLQQRSQTTAQLVSDTLSFRDQVVAKEQNGNMLQLNKSAVFITTLTLLYLPASFVASFFGMNFFDLDTDGDGYSRIIGTSMIWIYVVASIALTAVTFISYAWLLRNDSPILRTMAPKVKLVDWRGLSRRLTMKGGKAGSLV